MPIDRPHDGDPSKSHATSTTSTVAEALLLLDQRVNNLTELLGEVHAILTTQRVEKEWYTTTELAEAKKVSQYTVQERWCNQGRIECEKDPETGKWRIPGREYRRLVAGGSPGARNSITSAR